MFLATSEALSQYIHMMLEAVDTIELSKTGVNFMSWGYLIALWQEAEQSRVYRHSRTHKVQEKSLQTGHDKQYVDVMQLCITSATELIYSEIVSWVSL